VALVLLLGTLAGGAWQAQNRPGHAAAQTPTTQTPAPVPSSVGEVSFANSGAPAAQAPFLEGLAQLHNFEYESAVTLFQKAQEIDPGFAMAYWGEAMSYNYSVWQEQDRAAAQKVLARLGATPAARAAKAPRPREKAYLAAVETLYGEGEKYARDFAYCEAMANLRRAYPDDADAAAFYALSLLGTAHNGRDFAIYMRAAAVLEPFFQKFPRHPGVAHYLIHSYDDPIHAPLGLRAARAYSKIAPSAAHAQHMCSHIFVAMGLWDDVVEANEAATQVVNSAAAAAGRPPSVCGHYPFWLEYGYLEQGRFSAAKRVISACYTAATMGKQGTSAPVFDPDNSSLSSFAAMRARYVLDTENWEGEVAAWVPPVSGQPAAEVTLAFVTGLAKARSGHVDAARAALDQLRTARRALDEQLTKAQASDQGYGVRAKVLEDQLAALVSFAAGERDNAIKALQAAAFAEEKMPFEFGPPFVDKPSYELLGETLLAAGRPAEARVAFEKALTRTPRRTAAMLGLMRAAQASGDPKKAEAMRSSLLDIWRRADRLPKDMQ